MVDVAQNGEDPPKPSPGARAEREVLAVALGQLKRRVCLRARTAPAGELWGLVHPALARHVDEFGIEIAPTRRRRAGSLTPARTLTSASTCWSCTRQRHLAAGFRAPSARWWRAACAAWCFKLV